MINLFIDFFSEIYQILFTSSLICSTIVETLHATSLPCVDSLISFLFTLSFLESLFMNFYTALPGFYLQKEDSNP